MIIVKILLVLALVFIWIISCWIFYLAGIMKGFRNFIAKNADEWNAIDKVLYQQFTHKNMDNINPAAQFIAEGRIKEFNERNDSEAVKKARMKVIKEAAKEFKKETKAKAKKKKGGKK